jgi:hypothetical protein
METTMPVEDLRKAISKTQRHQKQLRKKSPNETKIIKQNHEAH